MTAPLVSACLIVRDARESIGGCIQALVGLADEVIVHDTGSTDGTRDVLRGFPGVSLFEEGWFDDFAAARNVALDQASGRWVLSVDADEVVVGDGPGFRAWLRDVEEQQCAVTIRIPSTEAGSGDEYTAVKLFRRDGTRWAGRVHERVVHPGLGEDAMVRVVPPELLSFRHSGFPDPGSQRRKGERNGRLAALELADLTADPDSVPEDVARAVLSLGRAAMSTGDRQQAIDAFTVVRDLLPSGQVWAEATDRMAQILLGAGEAWIAVLLADQLVQAGVDPRCCRWLRAQGLAQMGSVHEALVELDGLDVVVDTTGRRYDPAPLEQLREFCFLMG